MLTYGRNYGIGTHIGAEGPKADFEQPLKTWVPVSVAPSGTALLTSDRQPGWQGSLFVRTLRGQSLLLLEQDGNTVVKEDRVLGSANARIREVRQGPDGYLYVLTDSADGQLLRLTP
jgi:aldose sugar dehydrogenase